MSSLEARLRNWVLIVAGTAMLAACASGPDIRRESNPAAQFGTYKTFGFFPELATDRAGYESLFTSRMKEATRRVMESKGYTYTQDDPDLLLNFFANVQDKQEVRSTPGSMHASPYSMGYYGYRDPFYYGMSTPQVTTVNYKQGTVSIDLVDRDKRILAWSATAEGRIQKKTLQNPGPVIDELAQELMAPLPAAPGSM
jgi:hypothetical protein